MADNTIIQLPSVAGDTLSTEDLISYKIPRTKLALGAHGFDGGNVTFSNPFPVAAAGTFTVAVTNILPVGGDVASGTIDAGDPVKVGGLAKTTQPTAVSDGQRVNQLHDKVGRLVTIGSHVREQVVTNQITLITNAETTLLAAGGVNTFLDLTFLSITNTGNASVQVDFRDSTSGTIRLSKYVVAAGGNAVLSFNPPFPQNMANANWTAKMSGAVNAVVITAMAVKNI